MGFGVILLGQMRILPCGGRACWCRWTMWLLTTRSEVRPLLLAPNDNAPFSWSTSFLSWTASGRGVAAGWALQNNTGGGSGPRGTSGVRMRCLVLVRRWNVEGKSVSECVWVYICVYSRNERLTSNPSFLGLYIGQGFRVWRWQPSSWPLRLDGWTAKAADICPGGPVLGTVCRVSGGSVLPFFLWQKAVILSPCAAWGSRNGPKARAQSLEVDRPGPEDGLTWA